MRIYLYGDWADLIVGRAAEEIERLGSVLVPATNEADVAMAPLLRRKISNKEINAPRLGTLIFHPSLLPVHRGRDAIRWAFFEKEKYSGATWFWADDGYDTGDICEQEVLLIRNGETPRQFYERAVIPSALRMLRFIVADLDAGIVRKRPQIEENATYEPPFSERRRRVSH